MRPMDRREFLSNLTSSLVTVSAISLPGVRAAAAQYGQQAAPAAAAQTC